MKKLLLLFAFIVFITSFTSCTADELPATEHTVQPNTIDDLPPKPEDTNPPTPPVVVVKK